MALVDQICLESVKENKIKSLHLVNLQFHSALYKQLYVNSNVITTLLINCLWKFNFAFVNEHV